MTDMQFGWLIATLLGCSLSIGFGIARLSDTLRAIHAQLDSLPNILASLESIRLQTKVLDHRRP